VPLVGDAYRYWHKHNAVANLFRELLAEIRKDARIPYEDRESVRAQVEKLRVDPQFLGGIRAYMEDVDLDAIPALRLRLQQLLRLSGDTDCAEVIDIVVHTLQRTVNRAFRTDREATYHETRRSTKQVIGRVDDVEQRLSSQLAEGDARRAEEQASLTSKVADLERAVLGRRPEVGAGDGDASAGPERFLADLAGLRPEDEPKTRQLWETMSPDALAGLIRKPDSWLLGAAGEVWQTLGRMLAYAGQRRAALVAYDEAVERGVADPVRTLLRASGAARVDGDEERATELYAEAKRQASTHPAVTLRALEERRDDPDALLRELAGFQSPEPADMASAEVLRAQAALMRDEPQEALACAQRALELDPGSLGALELRALARLVPNQERYMVGEQPDHEAVSESISDLEAARDALRVQRRFDESGVLVGRIVDAYVILEDRGRAIAALQLPQLLDEERGGEAAAYLGRLAVLVGRIDLALAILSETSTDDDVRLLRAAALARGTDRTGAVAGAATLKAFVALPGDDDERRFAAMALLLAASDFPDIDWDDKRGRCDRPG